MAYSQLLNYMNGNAIKIKHLNNYNYNVEI